MSKFYTANHRAPQDKFATRRVADMVENGVVHGEFAEHERAFIESLDMFFRSTVDALGRPTVSYNGGASGFVKVLGPSTLLVLLCHKRNGVAGGRGGD